MLDLLLFGSSVALTKCISQDRSSSLLSSSSTTPTSPTASSIHKPSLHENKDVHGYVHSPATSQLNTVSRLIFQATLLLSLWLFCLSILEAAPTSWLLVVDQPSLFVQWYRMILWSLCMLLVLAMPSFLGVAVALKLSRDETLSSSSPTSPLASASTTNKTTAFEGRRSKNILMLCWTVLLVGIRFLFYIIQRLSSLFIPTSFRNRYNSTGTTACRSRECLNIISESHCLGRYCSLKALLAAVVSLTTSFMLLGSISSLVINPDTNEVDFVDNLSGGASNVHYSNALHSPLKYTVMIVCSFGMIIASTLNGFGCASLPHSNLVGMYLKPTSPAILAKVEEDYYYALKSVEEKRHLLQSSSNATHECQKLRQLREEINFLENLTGDMRDDIDEMKHSQQLSLAARTTFGRIRGALGVVFSVVLIIRVALAASSFTSILGSRSTASSPSPQQRRDPITIILLWLTGHNIVSDEQYNLFLQGTSLILAGVLSLSQVRNFFRVIAALSRKLNRTFGVSAKISSTATSAEASTGSSISLVLSSFFMGCYFLSCVVVCKMTLPIEYRSSFSAAVGKFDFAFNTVVLNIIFTAATCASAVILGLLFGIQRNNSERYQLESTLSSLGSTTGENSMHTA